MAETCQDTYRGSLLALPWGKLKRRNPQLTDQLSVNIRILYIMKSLYYGLLVLLKSFCVYEL